MKRFEGSIMYLRNKESEQIRNEIEMRKLQEKLISVRFKYKSVRQFENIIEDDMRITNMFYPAPKSLAVVDDDDDDETVFAEELQNKETHMSDGDKPDNLAADGRTNDDLKKNNTASSEDDDDVDDVPLSINFDVIGSAKSEEHDAAESDLLKNKRTAGDGDKTTRAELHELNSGIDEYECFTEAEFETGISEAITYGDDDSIEIDFVRETQSLEMSTYRLTVFEAFGVARVLEKWIDWINDWDKAERETPNDIGQIRSSFGFENGKRMREFVLETLKLTVQELRTSNTFVVLQRVNDSMLKEMRDEREIEIELASNLDKLNVLRSGEKKHKQQYNAKKLNVETKTRYLTTEFEKITKLLELENDYFRSWENQWLTENKELLNVEEIHLQNEMRAIDDDTKIETDYITEAKQTYLNYIDTLNEYSQTWETIYDRSVGAIDIDILTLEQEQEDLDDMHQIWQSNVDELQSSINDFEGRKNERDERVRFKTYMNNMAIRIQAFWRGTMVRRFLGPYKRLKKRSKKKSTTKTKKSKKK